MYLRFFFLPMDKKKGFNGFVSLGFTVYPN